MIIKLRFKNKIVFTAFILLFFTIFASRLFAAEYSHIYQFEAPEIITLSNGQHILKMKGAKLSDCRGLPAFGGVAAYTRKMSFRYSQLCGTASDTVDAVRSAVPEGFKF